MKLYGPSLHQIKGNQFSLELQIECVSNSGQQLVVLVLFKIDPKGQTKSHFLHELGLGTGQIKTMANNKVQEVDFDHPKALQDLIDHFYYVNYKGNSMFGSCNLQNPDTEYFLVTETVKISK
jgi:hypothetical protein